MKKHGILLCTIVIATFTFMGCGAPKTMTESKYAPNFGYTPQNRAQITENSLTVAIIDPVFSNGENNNLVEPYTSFVNHMADDIEEALNVNGFTIKGPYKDLDEMVYGDKLNSDFALNVEIEITYENGDFGKKSLPLAKSLMCKECYKVGGTFYHKGRILLTAIDPMDGERFWKKVIDLDRLAITTDGNKSFSGEINSLFDESLLSDTGVYNPVAKGLEKYYKEAIESIYSHIDPREMENISKQIKAKRARVGQ